MNKNVLIIFLFFSCLFHLEGATCTATVSGDWANASTWSCGGVPTCGDIIVIPAGYTVTISNQQNYSACTPTPAQSPQVYLYGTLSFATGSKLRLPCGSNFYIGAAGVLNAGSGGGNSNFLEICGTIQWNAASPSPTGPTCYPPGCSTAPLPIELIAFTGNLDVKVVFLNWQTATETNNNYFDVEKSSDGTNYSKIITVASKAPNGNSTCLLSYDVVDNDLKEPLYYYRLRQVDKNGASRYTKSISVKIYSPDLKIYPNPSNGQFWIEVPTAQINQQVDVRIYDHLSISVLDKTYLVVNDNITGAKVEIAPLKPLPKGVYIAIIGFGGIEYRMKLIIN